MLFLSKEAALRHMVGSCEKCKGWLYYDEYHEQRCFNCGKQAWTAEELAVIEEMKKEEPTRREPHRFTVEEFSAERRRRLVSEYSNRYQKERRQRDR